LLLVSPDTLTDVIGLAIVVLMVLVQYVFSRKKETVSA